MAEKKQPRNSIRGKHYIYVAREANGNIYYSLIEFHKKGLCKRYFLTDEIKKFHKDKIFCHRHKPQIIYNADFVKNLKLKKGEQVKCPIGKPIPVDNAERI